MSAAAPAPAADPSPPTSARRLPPPGPIYALADVDALAPLDAAAAVGRLAAAGVAWIQLRAKGVTDRELHRLAEAACRAVEGTAAALWIDDRPDVAALFSRAAGGAVAGVHLGQTDLPPVAARRIVGPGLAIGRSTHDPAQLDAALADPEVDVVAVGPVFATASKANPDPEVGLELVRHARRRIDGEAGSADDSRRRLLVAIGGIDAADLAPVLAAGADTVALISALCRPPAGAAPSLDHLDRNLTRLRAAAGGEVP